MIEFAYGYTHWKRDNLLQIADRPDLYDTHCYVQTTKAWNRGGRHERALIRTAGWRHEQAGYSAIFISHGILVAALGLLPAISLARIIRPRFPVRASCCEVCGYDLRATPERCPECGTLPATTTGK